MFLNRGAKIRRSNCWSERIIGGSPAQPFVRHLGLQDVDALLSLEQEKWATGQAASAQELTKRIETYPQLSIGAFCPRTGTLLASLFLKPAPIDLPRREMSWKECVESPVPRHSTALFGISLSSRALAGVDAILTFFWPIALAGGWRHVYLGSPIPGLRVWLDRNPGKQVAEYVQLRRNGAPRDPQLCYYHEHGFRTVVRITRDYFPHHGSLDYGVILRGTIPLSTLSPLWRLLPSFVVSAFATCLVRLSNETSG